ncbi:MAG: carbohydrate ABC transporter permease [Clostridiales bacterium]|nr:carbohydrate ABC transporter permease [Clostridiales bacterium]
MKKKGKWITYTILILLLIAFMVPFYLLVLNTFKTTQEFVLDPFSLPKFLNLDNYKDAIEKMNFKVSFRNTAIISLSTTLLNTVVSSMIAYVFSRKNWKINKILFMVLVASMVAPFQVYMIPLVKLYGGTLGLSNNLATVIYVGIGITIPFSVFLYEGFLNSIPRELDEAALIDGCSMEKTFFKIFLPLMKPIIVTVMVFVGLGSWNEYLMTSLFLTKSETRTLSIAAFTFLTNKSADYSPMMAGLVLGIIPILIFYLFGQKHIIEGVVQGSVKG